MKDRLRKSEYVVKPISHDTASIFIETYHYAGGAANTSVFSFGLFLLGQDFFESQVLGVSVWMPPTKNAALKVCDDFTKVLTLSRLAIKPDVPKNACTFLLAKSRKAIRTDGRFSCLVTFADTYRNHAGGIYKADNWEYAGQTKPSPVWINEAGRQMGRKRGGRNLTQEEMKAAGFEFRGSFPKHKFVFRFEGIK
jgi:hypothetical protein